MGQNYCCRGAVVFLLFLIAFLLGIVDSRRLDRFYNNEGELPQFLPAPFVHHRHPPTSFNSRNLATPIEIVHQQQPKSFHSNYALPSQFYPRIIETQPVLIKPIVENFDFKQKKQEKQPLIENDEPIELAQKEPKIVPPPNISVTGPVVKAIEPVAKGGRQFFQGISYPVVAGEKMPSKHNHNKADLSQPAQTLAPPVNSAAPLVRIVPIAAVALSAQMMPFVAGDLLPSPEPEPVIDNRQTLPVVAGSIETHNKATYLHVKSSKKTSPEKGGSSYEPFQPATLPPTVNIWKPTATTTLNPGSPYRTVLVAVENELRPLVTLIAGQEVLPTVVHPSEYVSSDEGTVPELVEIPARIMSGSNRLHNRKLYSCSGKRFVASEKEVGDVKCCGTKAYKWKLMICSGGDLYDPKLLALPYPSVQPSPPKTEPSTTTEAPETITAEAPRVKTRPPYVDFINNNHQGGHKKYLQQRPNKPADQQGIPFIQPDALPSAMIAAYYKQNPPTTSTSTSTSTTPATTTTTEALATPEPEQFIVQTTEPPILIDHKISDFEVVNFASPQRFRPDPDQIQIDPPQRGSEFEKFETEDDSSDQNEPTIEPEIIAFDKSVANGEIKQQVVDEVSMTTPEPSPATLFRSRMVLVRCNRQDWPISEPVGTYICCGDMLYYTLLDTIVCNDQIHPPLVIEEEHYNRAQQLFDVSAMAGPNILPSPASAMARSAARSSQDDSSYFHYSDSPAVTANKSFCETAADPRKFCCGEALYEKEFGQLCCNGVYGFSRAGVINCCGSALFDARTHECSESKSVVERKKRIISYFS